MKKNLLKVGMAQKKSTLVRCNTKPLTRMPITQGISEHVTEVLSWKNIGRNT